MHGASYDVRMVSLMLITAATLGRYRCIFVDGEEPRITALMPTIAFQIENLINMLME